jgi:integrase
MTRQGHAKKTSTMASDAGRIERHIRPLLGSMLVAAVTSKDVEKFMHDVADGKTAGRKPTAKKRGMSTVKGGRGASARVVGLLGGIFTYAVRQGMRADNPCRGVRRPADAVRDRRLSDAEYLALGEALRQAEVEGVWPPAVAATRFLALCGWRSGEVLGVRWADVDLARRTATLPDTKTGRSTRPLSTAACDLLRSLGPGAGAALVFPPTRGTVMTGFRKHWNKIMAPSAVPTDVHPHVLRHSFASQAADAGYSELTIAALIGHRSASVTSRYVHSADAVLIAAADAVARRIQILMNDAPAGADVVQLRAAAVA